MISRRALLRSLLALPIAATVDVEQLLWIPGQQIVVPAVYPYFAPKYWEVSVPLSLDEINAITLRNIMPAVIDHFFETSLFTAVVPRSR